MHVLAVVCSGLLAGLSSGLLGITPGGLLVPCLVLLAGRSQHQAQALSLVAQLLPGSLAGLRPYWQGGHRINPRWVAWLAAGVIPGSYLGARIANGLADTTLRWGFIAYLGVLLAISLRRRRNGNTDEITLPTPPLALLLGIGLLAGVSSGLLGIGGGLAVIALLTALAGLTQHAAQAVSLALAALPLALPAVYVYARGEQGIDWNDALLLMAGLLAGTYAGAKLAARLSAAHLQRWFVVLLGLMLLWMIAEALKSTL